LGEVPDQVWVGVADAVAALRDELTAAMVAAENQRLRFEVGEVEMTFQVVVNKQGGGNAGVNLGVVTLGGQGGISRESTHQLVVKLNPKQATGEPVEIAGEHSGGVPDR
jgi:hypothetical protein